jgi:hypothetical protein
MAGELVLGICVFYIVFPVSVRFSLQHGVTDNCVFMYARRHCAKSMHTCSSHTSIVSLLHVVRSVRQYMHQEQK